MTAYTAQRMNPGDVKDAHMVLIPAKFLGASMRDQNAVCSAMPHSTVLVFRGGPGISDRVISYSRLRERRDVMGKVTRKRYGAEFKAKVALEAIQGHRTVAELATKHELHPTQIAAWKREAVEKLAQVFDDKNSAREQNRDAELTKLHAKIGQLVVERDFLSKAFDR